jgi:uncharacterized protein YjdB
MAADLRTTVASVVVTPSTATGTVGDTARFAATVLDSKGLTLSRTVTWSSTDTTVVRVDAYGLARAVGAGSARVVATASGVSGSAQATVLAAASPVSPSVATVTVSPATATGNVGDSAQFSAVARDSSGTQLTGLAVTWSSSNVAVVTVSASGMGKAVGSGSASVVATVAGVHGTAAVTVLGTPLPAVASVTVSPGSATGNVGDSLQFTAVARDASGNVLTGRTITWSSTNTAVVTASAMGMGKATGAGSASLVATVDGVHGASAITVLGSVAPSPAPVATVTVSPVTLSVALLGTGQLTATTRDALGNVLTGRTITWSSSNALVASVGTTGIVSGLLAGTALITATAEGVSGSATVTVALLSSPASTTGWPNAPTTYGSISDQPWNLLNTLGWATANNSQGLVATVTDLTSLLTGSSSLQFTYPAGMAGGTAPGMAYIGLNSLRHFYAGNWWKANAGWQGHNSNVNKLQFLYTNGGGDMCMVMYGTPGGPYELRTAIQFIGADSRIWLVPNVANVNVTVGSWHQIEWQVETGTPGVANGIVKWWIDGTLVGSYSDVLFPSAPLTEYQLSPTWGGVGDTKLQTDYFWFDQTHVLGY